MASRSQCPACGDDFYVKSAAPRETCGCTERARERKKRAAKVNGFVFSQQLLLAAGRTKTLRLWRQNVGLVRKADGGMFKAGAPKGASDLTGIRSDGVRIELEVKGEGDTELPQQAKWGAFIRSMGGVYHCAYFDKKLSMKENCDAAMKILLTGVKQ